MGLFRKDQDFISPAEELKEAIGGSVKGLLDGRTLADQLIRKNLMLILFLTALVVLYIANGYRAEQIHKQRVELEREVQELRFESITNAARLMSISKQSEIKRRVNEEGLRLEESKEPPVKLYKK